jgi:hypothetical protein
VLDYQCQISLQEIQAMKTLPQGIGQSFAFAAALSAIVLMANIAGMFATGTSDVGMSIFICFLPMAFWMADASQRQTRAYVDALEARIRQLETVEKAT